MTRRAHGLAGLAAVVATCATLSVVFSVFDAAGSTPWFPADQAALVARCDPLASAAKRHACLQRLARQAFTTRVAAR